MAALSTYAANKILDHIRGVTAWSTAPTVYIGLSTGSASTAGTPATETTYTNYSRVALSGLLSAASAGSGTNSSVIPFAACGATGATITGFFTWDASSGGNMLEFGTCSLVVSSGITPQFAISAFVTTLT